MIFLISASTKTAWLQPADEVRPLSFLGYMHKETTTFKSWRTSFLYFQEIMYLLDSWTDKVLFSLYFSFMLG